MATVTERPTENIQDADGIWTLRRATIEADAGGAAAPFAISSTKVKRRTLIFSNESASATLYLFIGTTTTTVAWRSYSIAPGAQFVFPAGETALIKGQWSAADAGKFCFLTEVFVGVSV